MIRGNTIEFHLSKKESMAGTALYQYDYGQRLVFSGPELPPAYEVHFSNSSRTDAVTQIGDGGGVDIPDALLLTGKPVLFWLYLHAGEDDGETEYAGVIPVIKRPRPTDETPTPVQQDAITEAIAALNAAVTRTETARDAAETAAGAAGDAQEAAEDAQDAAETAKTAAETAQAEAETAQAAAETAQGKAEDAQEAAEAAKEAAEAALAEFTSPTATATTLTAGSDATAEYSNGVFTFGIPRGQKGGKGDPGDDGISPVATVTKSGSTATITITDANGTTTATVSDGEDGQDGEDGDPGQDGVTPSFSIGTVTTGAAGTDASATITGTDAEPVLNLTIPRGNPGEVTEADLAEALLDKADVIVDSASGAVASFPDGAAAPVVGLTVGVEPVQDLHGYDAPWPAGGGVNKWHLYANGYYSNSGTFSLEPSNGCSEKMPTTPGQTWTFSALNRGTEQVRLRGYFFDANDAIVGSQVAGNNTISGTAPEGAVTVAWWYSVVGHTDTITQAYSDSIGIQVELGSTATSWTPYSNICPITGWTGVKAYRTGKNLLSTKLYTGLSYNPAVGTVANFVESADQFATTDNETFTITFASTWQVRAMYCPVKPGQTYRYKRYIASTTLATTRGFLDRNFSVISTYNSTDATQNFENTITAPDNAAYFFFLITNRSTANDTVTVKDIQLELGSTATAYEPYAGQVYDITFPSEAGTVYGGSLDAVTGVLTVDKEMIYAKDINFTINPVALNDGTGYYIYCPNVFPAASRNNISNVYKASVLTDRWEHRTFGEFQTNTTSLIVTVPLEADTLVKAKQWILDNNPYFVYELATPLTYQLTPTEVTTLLGQNNVWADTGDTAVEYRADTKKYIDKKLAALVAQIVNS